MELNGIKIDSIDTGAGTLTVFVPALPIKDAAALDGQDLSVTDDAGAVSAIYKGYALSGVMVQGSGGESVTILNFYRKVDDSTTAAISQLDANIALLAGRVASLPADLSQVERAARVLLSASSPTLSDESALSVPDLLPAWSDSAEYGKGEVVSYDGSLYRCLSAHRSQPSWTPGASPSLWARILPGQTGEVGEWQQPDSTNPYMKGDKVTHAGKTWVSTADNNVWEPGAVGAPWEEIEG